MPGYLEEARYQATLFKLEYERIKMKISLQEKIDVTVDASKVFCVMLAMSTDILPVELLRSCPEISCTFIGYLLFNSNGC